jgi:hypothetical protein
MGEWQPIETAPRDGTTVLLYPATWKSKPCSMGKFNPDKDSRKPNPYWSRDDDNNRIFISRKAITTHWMPPPPPPKE